MRSAPTRRQPDGRCGPTGPRSLRDSHICLRNGDEEARCHGSELGPSGAHGFGSGRFVVAVPSAETGNDPGEPSERVARMGVLLTRVLRSRFAPMASAAGSKASSMTSVAGRGPPSRALTSCIVRVAAAIPTKASLNSRPASFIWVSSSRIPSLFNALKISSIRHLRRYRRTISCASAALVTGRVVRSRHNSGVTPAGPSISRASTICIVRCGGSERSPPCRGREITIDPARTTTFATRPGTPTREGATTTSVRANSGHEAGAAKRRVPSSSTRSCAARTIRSTPAGHRAKPE